MDAEKEYRKGVNILISANRIKDALDDLYDRLITYDCEIISIKKTGIVDILERD